MQGSTYTGIHLIRNVWHSDRTDEFDEYAITISRKYPLAPKTADYISVSD